MVNPVLLAAPVTILPAVAALWYLLKRYEDYFEDARVFLSLTLGFFLGLLAIAMEVTVFPFQDPRFVQAMGEGSAFVFFTLGYAFFETGAKVAVLGSKRFRGKKDAPYYGAAMGLGMGAMMALGFVALNLNASEALVATRNATAAGAPGLGGYSVPSFLAMASVPLGAVFVHGAAGVYVGKYTGEGRLWKGWVVGTLLQFPVLGAYWLFWPSIGQGSVVVLFPAVMSLAYGLGLLAFARTRVLDTIVPQHIRDQVRRERRRAARRGREPEADSQDDREA